MRCYSHHQSGVTLLGWGQKQIQISMGGGRDQYFMSSVFAWRPRGSVKGAICGCISIWETLRAARRWAAYPEGQGWQRGMGKAYSPASCCPPTSFQQYWAALPREALHGFARLLGQGYFLPLALLFTSPFLSTLEGIVLMSLYTSLFFFFLGVNSSFFPPVLSSWTQINPLFAAAVFSAGFLLHFSMVLHNPEGQVTAPILQM